MALRPLPTWLSLQRLGVLVAVSHLEGAPRREPRRKGVPWGEACIRSAMFYVRRRQPLGCAVQWGAS